LNGLDWVPILPDMAIRGKLLDAEGKKVENNFILIFKLFNINKIFKLFPKRERELST
jgi:hypothetical protein